MENLFEDFLYIKVCLHQNQNTSHLVIKIIYFSVNVWNNQDYDNN